MIFAALKWICSTLCSNAVEQVPQTNMPYVARGTSTLNRFRYLTFWLKVLQTAVIWGNHDSLESMITPKQILVLT